MASTSYDINVNTSQALKAVGDLHQALAGLVTGAVVTGFAKLADSTAKLQNQLSQVTQTGQTQNQMFKTMLVTANNLGAPLEQVSNLYTKLALNTKDLQISQTELMGMTDTLTKAFALNGQSAAQADASITQFTQALAKGKPDGEELSSILEGMAPVADALQKRFHTTRDGLKELASQGKVGANDLRLAVKDASVEIDKLFSARVRPISESFNILKNSVSLSVEEFDKQNQITLKVGDALIILAQAVIDISQWFSDYGKYIYYAGAALATFLIPLRLITAAFALFETASVAIGTRMAQLGGVASGLSGIWQRFLVVVLSIGEALTPGLTRVVNTFKTTMVSIEQTVAGVTTRVSRSLADLFPTFYNGLRSIGALVMSVIATIGSMLGLGTVFAKLKEWWDNITPESATKRIAEYNKKMEDAAKLSDKANEKSKNDNAADIKNKKAISDAVDRLTQTYKDLNTQLETETKGIGLGDEQRAKLQLDQDALKKYNDEVLKIKESFKNNTGGNTTTEAKAIEDLNKKYQEETDALNKAYDAKMKAQHADELRVYSLKELYNAQDKLGQLQDDIRKTTLSEVEKKYYDIGTAAKESAEAELRAAAERRGIKREDMPIAEVQAYYAAAFKGVSDLITATNELNQVQEKENIRLFALKEQYQVQDDLKKLQDDINKSTMTELEKKYYDIAAAADATAKSEIRAAAARQNIKIEDMPTEQVKAYYDAAYAGMEELKTKTKEQYDVSREFSTGWKKAFADYTDDATNAAKTAQELFSTTTKGIEDMLIGFTKTGKFAWKDMLASMMEDLLRSQIKQTIASIFGLAGGGSTGTKGGSSGLLGLLGFANGGLIPTNGPVLVGERGPELLSGAAGRTVTPNNQLGGVTNITYSINAVDAMSFKQMIASDPTFLYAVSEQGRKRLPGGR